MTTTITWDHEHPDEQDPAFRDSQPTFWRTTYDSWVIALGVDQWAARFRALHGDVIKEPAWVSRVRRDGGLMTVEGCEIRR